MNSDASPLEVSPEEEIKTRINLYHDLRKAAEKPEYENIKIDEKLDDIFINEVINIFSKDSEKINTEDSLMKVIEDITKQMDYCKNEILYMGTETKPFLKKDIDPELKPNESIESTNDPIYTHEAKKYIVILKWVSEHIIVTIFVGIVGTVVGGIILNKIYP